MGGPGAPLQLAGPRSGVNEVTSQCRVHHRRPEFPLGRAGGAPPFQPPAPLTTAPPAPAPGARAPGERPLPSALQVALAPYRHLEEDMRSLKQVLEMKNQQIHQQEKRIAELEKLVSRGVFPGRPRPSPPPAPSPRAASGPGPRPARCSR